MNGYEYAIVLVAIPKVGTILEVVSFIFGAIVFAAGFTAAVTTGDEYAVDAHNKAKQIFKPSAWVFAVALPLATLWPTKTDLVTIIGGGVAYEIVTSDEAKEIGELSLEFVKRKLKEEN